MGVPIHIYNNVFISFIDELQISSIFCILVCRINFWGVVNQWKIVKHDDVRGVKIGFQWNATDKFVTILLELTVFFIEG